MRGRRLVTVAVIVLVIGGLVGAYLLLRPESNPVSPLPPEQAKPSAERACLLMKQFESQVLTNTQAKLALATLEEALTESNRASRGDVVFVPLESGIRAVRAGFRKNDARATRVGIDVVRYQCGQVTTPAPGAQPPGAPPTP